MKSESHSPIWRNASSCEIEWGTPKPSQQPLNTPFDEMPPVLKRERGTNCFGGGGAESLDLWENPQCLTGPQAGQPTWEGVGLGYPCFARRKLLSFKWNTAPWPLHVVGFRPHLVTSQFVLERRNYPAHRDKTSGPGVEAVVSHPTHEHQPLPIFCWDWGGGWGRKWSRSSTPWQSATTSEDAGWLLLFPILILDCCLRPEPCHWTFAMHSWSACQQSSVSCHASQGWYAELALSPVAGPWSEFGRSCLQRLQTSESCCWAAARCQRQTEVSDLLWLEFKLEQYQGRVLHS